MNIKNERKRKGLTQIKLAKLSNVSRFKLFLHEHEYKDLSELEFNRVKEAIEKYSEYRGQK